MAYTLGCDLSHWQGTPNFGELKTAGIGFAILKASEGAYSTDGSFPTSADNAHNAGIYVGAYHFAQPSQSSGSSQAQRFLNILDGHHVSSAWLDIEVTGGLGRTSLGSWCRDFLYTLADGFPGIMGAYCSRSYAEYLGNDLFAGRSKRWIASPGYRPSIDFDIWQSSWKGRLPSISGDVDLDIFEGDLPFFKSWLGIVDPPVVVPPPIVVPPVIPSTPVFHDHLLTIHTSGFAKIVAAANGDDHTTEGARSIVRAVFGALAQVGHGSPHSLMVTEGIVTPKSKPFATLVLRQWQTHLGHPATGVLTNSELMAVGSAAPGHLFHVIP